MTTKYYKKWYKQNREKLKEYHKEYNKQYYKKHKNKIKEKQKTPKIKEYQKQYRKNNKEKLKQIIKKWVLKNPNYHKEYSKQYYKRNKPKIQKQIKRNRKIINLKRILKAYNITYKQYKEITKRCFNCGFNLYRCDIHHKDKNKNNNELNNLIGLCPNCHLGIHRNKLKIDLKHTQNTHKIKAT